MAVTGAHEFPKQAADVVAMGDLLYWDDINIKLTITASGNSLAGAATTTIAS